MSKLPQWKICAALVAMTIVAPACDQEASLFTSAPSAVAESAPTTVAAAAALETVQFAAQATAAAADNGRVRSTFSMEGADGTVTESAAGTVDASLAGDDVALSLDLSQLSPGLAAQMPPVTETRLVGGMLYVKVAGFWISTEPPAILTSTLSDFTDPLSILTQVEELAEADEVGSVAIQDPNGATVETTHYRSVVSTDQESLGLPGWMPGQEMAAALAERNGAGEVTVDLYVDGEGVLRQLDMSGNASGDIQEYGVDGGTMTFSISTSFFDLGSDIVVAAPSFALPVDLSDLGLGDLDLGFGDLGGLLSS